MWHAGMSVQFHHLDRSALGDPHRQAFEILTRRNPAVSSGQTSTTLQAGPIDMESNSTMGENPIETVNMRKVLNRQAELTSQFRTSKATSGFDCRHLPQTSPSTGIGASLHREFASPDDADRMMMLDGLLRSLACSGNHIDTILFASLTPSPDRTGRAVRRVLAADLTAQFHEPLIEDGW